MRSHLTSSPPRVAECPIQMESRIERVHPFGEADSVVVAIEVSVVRTYVREDMLVPGSDRHIDPEQWDPLFMKSTHFYSYTRNVYPSRLADAWDPEGHTNP